MAPDGSRTSSRARGTSTAAAVTSVRVSSSVKMPLEPHPARMHGYTCGQRGHGPGLGRRGCGPEQSGKGKGAAHAHERRADDPPLHDDLRLCLGASRRAAPVKLAV